jgi:hypothetical protein
VHSFQVALHLFVRGDVGPEGGHGEGEGVGVAAEGIGGSVPLDQVRISLQEVQATYKPAPLISSLSYHHIISIMCKLFTLHMCVCLPVDDVLHEVAASPGQVPIVPVVEERLDVGHDFVHLLLHAHCVLVISQRRHVHPGSCHTPTRMTQHTRSKTPCSSHSADLPMCTASRNSNRVCARSFRAVNRLMTVAR